MMIAGDNINLYDIMLTSKGNISNNFVSFLKEIRYSDMTENVNNKEVNLNYDTNNDLVYDLIIKNRTFATGIIPSWLTTHAKAYKDDAYNKGYN